MSAINERLCMNTSRPIAANVPISESGTATWNNYGHHETQEQHQRSPVQMRLYRVCSTSSSDARIVGSGTWAICRSMLPGWSIGFAADGCEVSLPSDNWLPAACGSSAKPVWRLVIPALRHIVHAVTVATSRLNPLRRCWMNNQRLIHKRFSVLSLVVISGYHLPPGFLRFTGWNVGLGRCVRRSRRSIEHLLRIQERMRTGHAANTN